MTFENSRPLLNYLLAVGLAVALAFGLANAPQAAEQPAPARPEAAPGRPAGPPPGAFGHHGHGLKELARLHDELKLDEKQETLWRAAETAVKDNFGSQREAMRKEHAELQAMLDQPGVDLRAVFKRMDESREAGRKQHDAVRDRWLAVYDALDAGQKDKARLFIKRQFERMDRFLERAPGRTSGREPVREPAR